MNTDKNTVKQLLKKTSKVALSTLTNLLWLEIPIKNRYNLYNFSFHNAKSSYDIDKFIFNNTYWMDCHNLLYKKRFSRSNQRRTDQFI